MSENGNGEVKRLIELKHDYKDEVSQLETDLKAKFEQELDAGKKNLKDKYLERVVDWFYSNCFNGNGQPPTPPIELPSIEVTPTPTPQVSVTVTPSTQTQTSADDLQPTGSGTAVIYCDECGRPARPDANYCSYCAAPLGKPKIRIAGHVASLDRERMIRIARQTAHAPTPEAADRRVQDWARTHRR